MGNYYADLGVSKDASRDEIKKTFHALAKRYHPDSGAGNAEQFKKINEAYSVLSNPSKRMEYDEKLRRETERAEEAERERAFRQRNMASEPSGFGRGTGRHRFFEERDEGGYDGSSSRGFYSGNPFSDDLFSDFFSGIWNGFSGYGNADGPDMSRSKRTARSASSQTSESYRTAGNGYSAGNETDRRKEKKTSSGQAGRQTDVSWTEIKNSRATVKVTREEAANGCRKKVNIRYKDFENGNAYAGYMVKRTFLVNIPSGIRDGMQIRLKGAGKPVACGGTGNAVVTVKIK